MRARKRLGEQDIGVGREVAHARGVVDDVAVAREQCSVATAEGLIARAPGKVHDLIEYPPAG